MHIHTFIADSATEAVEQIREKLGPEAVVLNVRRIPIEGVSGLWRKARIEVLAHLPEKPTAILASDTLAALRQELSEIRQKVNQSADHAAPPTSADTFALLDPPARVLNSSTSWLIGPVLEETGMSPLHVQRVLDELQIQHGETPPNSLIKEIDLARGVLKNLWNQRRTATHTISRAHVFIGAPGVGKTTCLCKWLAQTVLVEGRAAEVWRLDGRAANAAESLSIYCEILGVPVDRFPRSDWYEGSQSVLFIDLPGINPADSSAIEELARGVKALPTSELHLVLNAAYDLRLLLAQARAFSSLPISDVIFAHLDEEQRWGKLWSFVLGTSYNLRFLSAGQNVPGEFVPGSADRILEGQFRRNR